MAFGESWVIAIMLRFAGGQAMRGFQQLGMAAGNLEGKLTKAKKAMAQFDETSVAAGTRIAGSFALIGAAISAYGIYNAGKFQLAMAGAAGTLHATHAELKAMQNMVIDVSGRTAQSNVTTAQQFTTALTAGLDTMGATHAERIKNATALFWPLAQFSDSMQFMARSKGSNMSAVDATNYGIEFAHMFTAYTPDKMKNMLNWIMALTTVTAESPMRALTQSKYFVGLGTSVGLTPAQMFPMLAFMGQMGFLRARGGMATGRMLLAAIAGGPEGHLTKIQGPALAQLGLISGGHSTVLRGDQTLDWTKFNQILQADRGKYGPAGFANLIQRGFGVTAGQFMSVFENPASQKQYGRIAAQMGSYKGNAIDYFFKLFIGEGDTQGTFLGSLQKFGTNVSNVLTQIFLPLLPGMTRFFNSMAETLGRFASWLGKNPGFAGNLGKLILAFIGLSGARFALGMLVTGFRGLAALDLLRQANGLSRVALAFRALDNVALAGMGNKILKISKAFTVLGTSVGAIAGSFGTLAAMSVWFNNIVKHAPKGQQNNLWGEGQNRSGVFNPNLPMGWPPVHQTFNVHTSGTTHEQAKKIVSMAIQGIKSSMQSRGDTSWTNAVTAGVLGMEGAPITHGFG